MAVYVSDIIKIVEEIAPLRLAEKWDNSGLQVGDKDSEVRKVVLALDPSEDVVAFACSVNADMLITHHPLIFKPLKTIDFATPAGRIIKMAMENRLAIYSAHTNFDSAGEGLNEILASRLGLKEVAVLCKPDVTETYKLVFYVPTEQKNKLLKVLFETTAGIIGDYTCCSFLSEGNGTYKPGGASQPFRGTPGKIECADEVRIETIVAKNNIEKVVSQLRAQHPYETMPYDIYPLIGIEAVNGLGRVGLLQEPLTLQAFSEHVKKVLGIGYLKIAGNKDMIVKKVALCTGSGASLMNDFFASGADVYVSGDLHFHDALMVEEKGLGLVDAGHFALEILIAESLTKTLHELCLAKEYPVEFIACPIEKDPFTLI